MTWGVFLIATEGLNTLGGENPGLYKYYVAIRYIKKDAEDKATPPKTVNSVISDEKEIQDMTEVLMHYYDAISLYDLVNIFDARYSSQSTDRVR